jgi:integrase
LIHAKGRVLDGSQRLSGNWKQAKRLGFYDGINPVQDTAVDPHAAEAAATHAYSLEEVLGILACLPEPAGTVFAVAAFTGLRRGEIEALEWPDVKGNQLHVSRSVWNGRVTVAKTRASCAPVPLIEQVVERLELHRLRSGSPDSGPVFRNEAGGRLNMNNLLNRVILPALNRCHQCGKSEGRAHLKADHKYERDPSRPSWHGFHAGRRGLGSNLYRLGVSGKIIQQILRHSNVNVTLSYYVKNANPDVVAGMQKLEDKLSAETLEKSAVQSLRDSLGTLKPASGTLPGLVQ